MRLLALEQAHALRRIACSCRRAELEHPIERRDLLVGNRQPRRRDVLFQIALPFRAGDRHDVWPLRQQPGERELWRRAPFSIGCALETFAKPMFFLQFPTLEPRYLRATFVLFKLPPSFEGAPRKPPP